METEGKLPRDYEKLLSECARKYAGRYYNPCKRDSDKNLPSIESFMKIELMDRYEKDISKVHNSEVIGKLYRIKLEEENEKIELESFVKAKYKDIDEIIEKISVYKTLIDKSNKRINGYEEQIHAISVLEGSDANKDQ